MVSFLFVWFLPLLLPSPSRLSSFPLRGLTSQHLRHLRKCHVLECELVAIPQGFLQILVQRLIEEDRVRSGVSHSKRALCDVVHNVEFRCEDVNVA